MALSSGLSWVLTGGLTTVATCGIYIWHRRGPAKGTAREGGDIKLIWDIEGKRCMVADNNLQEITITCGKKDRREFWQVWGVFRSTYYPVLLGSFETKELAQVFANGLQGEL